MKKLRYFFYWFLFLLFVPAILPAQRNNVWCFGDSALVDFSDTSNISFGTSIVNSRGSCATICDSTGTLLFYSSYDYDFNSIGGPPFQNGEIFNSQNSTMQNGDSIVMAAWYLETVIIPLNALDFLYYVFSTNVTGNSIKGIFYSIVDMSLNGGLGAVIQKNVQLENFKTVDCLTAVKHGNGRDWWVIFRRFDTVALPNNDYYVYLVTPSGVINQTIQSVGSQNSTNLGRISFNSQGTRMAFINYTGLIELYDFNRCTGIINNPVTIAPESTQAPWPGLWSAEFSPSGNILYVTRLPAGVTDSSRLFQYNLLSPNISASKLTLWTTPWLTTMGQLKRAPDNKIYIATNLAQVYPYQDTMYTTSNMNLSVISSPDSLGFACDLQPFSFYLGGKRSYVGLPNNPDYELGPLAGSPCDTLVGISEQPAPNITTAELFVYYHPGWQTAFINGQKLTGHNYRLRVYDIKGKEIFSESGKLNPPYFTKNLNCASFAKGMYIVDFETEKERLNRKFVIE